MEDERYTCPTCGSHQISPSIAECLKEFRTLNMSNATLVKLAVQALYLYGGRDMNRGVSGAFHDIIAIVAPATRAALDEHGADALMAFLDDDAAAKERLISRATRKMGEDDVTKPDE